MKRSEAARQSSGLKFGRRHSSKLLQCGSPVTASARGEDRAVAVAIRQSVRRKNRITATPWRWFKDKRCIAIFSIASVGFESVAARDPQCGMKTGLRRNSKWGVKPGLYVDGVA